MKHYKLTAILLVGMFVTLAPTVLLAQNDGISYAAWRPRTDHLAVLYRGDPEVYLWDAIEYRIVNTIPISNPLNPSSSYIPGALVWSSDGSTLVVAIFSIEFPPALQAIDLETGQVLWTEGLGEAIPVALAWNPATNLIAVGTRQGMGIAEIDEVRIWDSTTGQQLKSWTVSDSICGLSWSPEGNRVAVALGITRPTVFDVDGNQVVFLQTGTGDEIYEIAWSPDGARIATGGARVNIWNVQTGQVQTTFEYRPGITTDLAWSPDGTVLAVLAEPFAWLWNTVTDQVVDMSTPAYRFVTWNADGSRLVTTANGVNLTFVDPSGFPIPTPVVTLTDTPTPPVHTVEPDDVSGDDPGAAGS